MAIKFQDSLEVKGGNASKVYLEGAGGTGSSTMFQAHNPDDGAGHGGGTAYLKSSGWGEAQLAVGGYRWTQAGGKMTVTGGVYYFNTGNVGIGTGNPAQKLDVNGAIAIGGSTFVDSTKSNIYLNSSSSSGGQGIFFRNGFTYNASITTEDHNGAFADGICISGYDGVSFSTGSNERQERMRVAQNGNVGIGVTNPTRKLHISAGSGYAALFDSTNRYKIGFANGGVEEWWIASNANGSFSIHENNVGDQLTISAGGNLTVNGSVSATGGNSGQWNIGYQNWNSYLSNRTIGDADEGTRQGFSVDYLLNASPFNPDSSLLTMSYSSIWSWQMAGDWRTGGLRFRGKNGGTWGDWQTTATEEWVASQGYITSETDSQTLSWNGSNGQLTISSGNTVDLDGRYEDAGAADAVNIRIDEEILPAIDAKVSKAGDQVTGTLSVGGSAAYDSTNLALDVQGNIGIWNDSKLYFKITADNFNTWSTSQYADGSTHKFNAQAFSFTNEGYSASVFMNINSSGVGMSRNLVLGNEVYGNSTAYGNWGARLMFNGSNSDAQGNYYIGTNGEDYGGNYSKLDLRWHTGIRMGAQAQYGGIRFYDNEDLNTRIMSIGETDNNIRIDNNLWIGGAGGWITDLLAGKANASHTHSYLPLSGGTLTGNLVTPSIDVETFYYHGTQWYEKKYVRSVGLSGSAIGNSWVLLGTIVNNSSYERSHAKFTIHGYDDVSSGTEIIIARAENSSTAQEIHSLNWYSNDSTANLFSEVQSIRQESSGLQNVYEIWVKMAGDWRDTFTVSLEWWNSHSREFNVDSSTVLPEGEIPNVGVDNISQVTRKWYIGSEIFATGGDSNQWNTAYEWGNHAGLYDAAGSADAVNLRIEEEVLPAIDAAVSNLVDSAPSALNTLNELAAALGDDVNFSTTVTNSLASKLSTSGGKITRNGMLEVIPGSYSYTSGSHLELYTTDNHVPAIGFHRAGVSATTLFEEQGELFITKWNADGTPLKLWNRGDFDFQDFALSSEVPTNNNQLTNGAGYYSGTINLGSSDLVMQGSDPGDIVWKDASGTENHRIWAGSPNHLTYRNNAGTAYAIVHTGLSGYNASNWDTAYGWGNHAGLYDAAGAADAVNLRIEEEVLPLIDSKADVSHTHNASDITSGTLDGARLPWAANDGFSGTYPLVWKADDRPYTASWLNIRGSDDTLFTRSISANGKLFVGNGMWVNGNNATVYNNYNENLRLPPAGNNVSVIAFRATGEGGEPSSSILGFSDRHEVRIGGTWRERIYAGTTSINNTLVVFGNALPDVDRTRDIGREDNRWRIVFCEILDSAGLHEKNLQNPKGEKQVGEYETGTVLVWKGGKNVPCTEPADHMRMGIAVKDVSSPLVQGAEPVLCTGKVNEGDYLVTSSVEGHAAAISPQYMRQHGLYDCVIGKALESAEGKSHLVKTWVNI